MWWRVIPRKVSKELVEGLLTDESDAVGRAYPGLDGKRLKKALAEDADAVVRRAVDFAPRHADAWTLPCLAMGARALAHEAQAPERLDLFYAIERQMARAWFNAPVGLYERTADEVGPEVLQDGFEVAEDLPYASQLQVEVDRKRDSVRTSYREHGDAFDRGEGLMRHQLDRHAVALYGALATWYAGRFATGGRSLEEAREKVAEMESFLRIELLPFEPLEQAESVEVLAEYIVWKEGSEKGSNNAHVRVDWLKAKIRDGVKGEGGAFSEELETARRARTDGGHTRYFLWVDLFE